MRTFRKYLVSLASAALVLGSLAATGAPVSAATVASAPFSDVTSSTQYANAINFLAAAGVINGTGNGVFQPTTPVTRAEMAKIVVLDAGKGSVANSLASMTPSFTDASSIPTWAWGYVNAAVAMGVVNGYPDGTFRANNNVTDAEALAMFTRALGDNWSVTGTWPNNYVLAGFNLGIAGGLSSVSANVPALRGEIAQMGYNAAINAEYTVVNSNGTNTLTSGGGLFTKNAPSGGTATVFPENIVGTVSSASSNSITILPTAAGLGYNASATTQTAVTYGFESTVTLIGATALGTSLDGASVTATVDSNGLVNLIDVSTPTTTASDTLNHTGQGTSNFTLPTGYSVPAANSAEALANTSCFLQGGNGTLIDGMTSFNQSYNSTTNTGEVCNPNNKYDHVLVVQDSAGNNYLLMNDGKTIEYSNTTTITINGTNEGTLMNNEWRDLAAGATVTANTSSGIATSITETDSYDGNLVTSVNPVNGVLTFTAGSSTVFYVNGSSATVMLNGQPSTMSAIQPNDDVSVEPTAPSPMAAGSSLFGATLGASNSTTAASAQSISDTRNTVSGTITSTSTSTINLSWTGQSYTSVTITLQPSSGNAVTLTTDGDQPSAQNADLQSVNASVNLVLDGSGGILYVLSTSASSIPVAMLTGTGSSSSVSNGVTQTYTTLTGIAGSSTTTYNEATTGTTSFNTGTAFTCSSTAGAGTGAGQCSTASPAQPNTLTTGFTNFWALTMNTAGQVAQATYLAPIANSTTVSGTTYTDTFEVVSAGSSSVVIEALNSSGSVDTGNLQGTLTAYGFSNGYLTVTNGTAFSGVTSEKYIGFSGLQANDVVNLYYVAAPNFTGGNTFEYAVVDTYR